MNQCAIHDSQLNDPPFWKRALALRAVNKPLALFQGDLLNLGAPLLAIMVIELIAGFSWFAQLKHPIADPTNLNLVWVLVAMLLLPPILIFTVLVIVLFLRKATRGVFRVLASWFCPVELAHLEMALTEQQRR